MNRLASSLLLATLFAACNTDDGIWMPDDGQGGKADSVTTIKGSDIPSQHVDPNKSYILSRQITTLQQVGAFDAVQDRLVQRIDGIIANMPSDKRLHLAELVRMETPAIHDSLFPDEVAALPSYWKMMEAPASNDFVVGPDATFGVVDASTPPGPAQVPSFLAISSLATELQTPATRLQNKHDADGDPTTVQYQDLVLAIASPGPFTAAEITAFGQIQAVFRDKAVAVSAAEIVVSPSPGPYAKAVTVGPVGLNVAGDTTFTEERSNNGSQLVTRLTATQTQTTTATLPADAKLLLINKDSRGESAHPSGLVPLPGGQYVFEVWANGQRTFHTNVHTGDLTRTSSIDLTSNLDYTLVAGLAPLVRSVTSAGNTAGIWSAKFTYAKTSVPPTGTIDQNALTRVATPTVKIPTGRYQLRDTNFTLHVYPNNVLWIVPAGQTGTSQAFRLLPALNTQTLMPGRFYNQQQRMAFDAVNSTLRFEHTGQVFTLTASMRDI